MKLMKITIDGRPITVDPSDKNIVDVADREKIAIPEACYHAERRKGCCRGCVVEIDGEQKYACVTEPSDGMEIVVDRADLKATRTANLREYHKRIKSGAQCGCDSSGTSDCCG
jgi:NADH dehydrogenase/NADH:ubiquinone oxidoreductase subunit G